MGGGRRSASGLRSRTTSEKRDATDAGCVYVASSATTERVMSAPTAHAQRQLSQQLLSSVLEQ